MQDEAPAGGETGEGGGEEEGGEAENGGRESTSGLGTRVEAEAAECADTAIAMCLVSDRLSQLFSRVFPLFQVTTLLLPCLPVSQASARSLNALKGPCPCCCLKTQRDDPSGVGQMRCFQGPFLHLARRRTVFRGPSCTCWQATSRQGASRVRRRKCSVLWWSTSGIRRAFRMPFPANTEATCPHLRCTITVPP